MKVNITQQSHDDWLKGYTILDCSILDHERYCFVLSEENRQEGYYPLTRIIHVIANDMDDEQPCGTWDHNQFRFTSIVRNTDPPEFVAVDLATLVFSSNAQKKGEEKPIDKLLSLDYGEGSTSTSRRVIRAAGKVYAVGSGRRILRREGVEQWVDLRAEGKGVPLPEQLPSEGETSWSITLGFQDLAAFAANDMYAVGGYGDVWRFNGEHWQQCAFPSNAHLETVCCGSDGRVYISDQKGKVWAGRENRWELLANSDLPWGSQPIDAVWFADRLILGGWGGLFALDGKELVPLQEIDPRSPNAMVSGRLDVSPCGQFLLTAGPYGACLYNGQRWTRLFSMFDFD
ncbi:hypothetical protein ABHF33_01250 [Chitinibacter sp. FCG-7]|uniref:Uncharacterized protein n=1 Tax=Chitinibacter mangrovi TaxID=3153927 RepID=A0AAU7FAP6_9NEIS